MKNSLIKQKSLSKIFPNYEILPIKEHQVNYYLDKYFLGVY